MLEFVFRGEFFDENYPQVVLLSEKWQADIKRLDQLKKNVQETLIKSCEIFDLAKVKKLKIITNNQMFVVMICQQDSYKTFVHKLYAEIADLQKVQIFAAPSCKLDVSAVALALEGEAYRFDKYKTKQKSDELPALETVCFPQFEKPDNWKETLALANGIRYAKDLGNEPSNFLTPEVLGLDIKRLEYLDIRVDLFDWNYITKNKIGLIEAVAKGSTNKPCLAVMQYLGNPNRKDWTLGLVGKGVTYDSGGISLKLDDQQIGEKKDMCGAAAVIAAMKVAALQKLPINLVAVLPIVENMPAANAYKPDDVLISMSAQTVEVVDTDAEGRLILADALWYLQEKFRVKKVIDIATLTGSTSYIFAGHYAALLGNDDSLMKIVQKAAKISGEKVWELPMDEEIDKRLKSEIADLKQLAKKEADSTQAACFLRHFIKQGVAWAHLDIAGCEADKSGNASGFGVALLVNIIHSLMEKK